VKLPATAGAALALLALTLPATATAKPYTTTPGPARPDARFAVSYTGTGTYKTTFHATPPNDGGKPDTNDAHDSSTQAWQVKFLRAVAIPTCGQPSDGSADPCATLTGVTGAKGPTEMTGRVRHKHVDGLYRQLDRTVNCDLKKKVSPRRRLETSIVLRYIPESRSIGVSATSPLATTISLFPLQCPEQGDSIDRILDFYATPGFSFANGYGPERWFASREVVIPAGVFHRSSKITIPLRVTRAGTPPKGCRRPNASFERCTTGGSWSGILTFKTKP
jgi:hypothetical protein